MRFTSGSETLPAVIRRPALFCFCRNKKKLKVSGGICSRFKILKRLKAFQAGRLWIRPQAFRKESLPASSCRLYVRAVSFAASCKKARLLDHQSAFKLYLQKAFIKTSAAGNPAASFTRTPARPGKKEDFPPGSKAASRRRFSSFRRLAAEKLLPALHRGRSFSPIARRVFLCRNQTRKKRHVIGRLNQG